MKRISACMKGRQPVIPGGNWNGDFERENCPHHQRGTAAGVGIMFLILLAVPIAAAASDASYKYFRVGNANDVHPATRGGFALIGGGKDLDDAFQWLCQRSGGGDFLVVRATGTDAYNPYIAQTCHVNSVATLIIPDRAAAADPFVKKKIREASAIFISGGDQANYVNFWQGTPVQYAINDAIRRGVPLGGTSAGLAVQGEFVYSAQGDKPDGPDLHSPLALADPWNPQTTIVRGFLEIPPLQKIITDTHFGKRDRMGRLLVYLARILNSRVVAQVKGIGIDEHTAVLLDSDGNGHVVGTGSAYFLRAQKRPAVCKKGVPLSFADVSVRRLRVGAKFNMTKWQGDGDAYMLSVRDGKVNSTQSGGGIY